MDNQKNQTEEKHQDIDPRTQSHDQNPQTEDISTENKNSYNEPQPQEQEDLIHYPKSYKLALVVLALNLGIFCVGLDNTIISSAIPRITDHFHALDDVGWYASSYLLTTCSFQLAWGKIYSTYSIKWTFLSSLFIFELGSLICGVSPTSTALIVGRAVAGIGGGGVGSGCFLLIAHSVEARRRPTLIGMMGGMYGFAAIAGPLLGGALTDTPRLTWRFCFYINLPIGFFTAVCVYFFVHTEGGKKSGQVGFKEQIRQMDLPGTALLLPGVICLLLALQWGGTNYAWKNGRIIALLVLAVVFLAGFVVIQLRSGDRATVPVRVFGNRNIWGSALFGGCVVGGFYVVLYYVSSLILSHQERLYGAPTNSTRSQFGFKPSKELVLSSLEL